MDGLEAVRRRTWDSRFYHPPTQAALVPTMLTPEEGNMLSWLGEHYFRGEGDVVELGCFLGGSTVWLASGLERSGRKWTLHSYDRFLIDENNKERFLYRAGYPRFDGQDMFPIFCKHIEPFAGNVTARRGDVERHPWQGGPIEILFIDLAKTVATHNFVLDSFFKSLIPGRSIVVQQDYLHHQTPWLIATMEMLHPKLELVSWARHHSVLFFCREAVTDRDLQRVRYERLRQDEVVSLFLQARERFQFEWQREMVAQALDTYRASPEEHRGDLVRTNSDESPSLGPYSTLGADAPSVRPPNPRGLAARLRRLVRP
jgi:hypothetical protein